MPDEHSYGWHPSLPDFRDLPLSAAGPVPATTPTAVDLRNDLPPVRDQGPIGSCTGFGATNAYYATCHHNGQFTVDYSALFAYYNARSLEGTTRYDAGATCRDVIKGLAKWGAAPEETWPYENVTKRFDDRPPARAYNAALRHQALRYYAVGQTSLAIRQALTTGYVVIIGFSVYESFESDKVASTGVVPLPEAGERLLSGHCVVLYGYNQSVPAARRWRLRNQWGADWGDHGDFWMHEDFLTNPRLAGDFWTIRTGEG